jgi:hypothetical protein
VCLLVGFHVKSGIVVSCKVWNCLELTLMPMWLTDPSIANACILHLLEQRLELSLGTGACNDCRLVSEPLHVGDVAPSNQILGAALNFLRVTLRGFSCTMRCVPREGRCACLDNETSCVDVEG